MSTDWNPSPDPLVIRHLPTGDESPDACELCERINELPRSWANYETIRYLVILILIASTAGSLPRYADGVALSGVPELWLLMLTVKIIFCVVLYLLGAIRLRFWLGITGLWILIGAALWIQTESALNLHGYLSLFVIAVGVSTCLSFLITNQYVFYAAASLNNEWYEADSWRCDWIGYCNGFPPNHRPEFLPFMTGLKAVALALAAGVVASSELGFGELAFFFSLMAIVPFYWPKDTDPLECIGSCWRALEVFLTYERKPFAAPGVFRFPSRWLRPHKRRIVAVLVPLVMVSLSVGTFLPLRRPQLPNYDHPEKLANPRDFQTKPAMTQLERTYFETIPSPIQKADYLSFLELRRASELAIFQEEQKNYEKKVFTTVIACVLIPPAVVFGTLVFLFGPVLAVCRRNLDSDAE